MEALKYPYKSGKIDIFGDEIYIFTKEGEGAPDYSITFNSKEEWIKWKGEQESGYDEKLWKESNVVEGRAKNITQELWSGEGVELNKDEKRLLESAIIIYLRKKYFIPQIIPTKNESHYQRLVDREIIVISPYSEYNSTFDLTDLEKGKVVDRIMKGIGYENILDMSKEERILFIEEVLRNDKYYTEEKGEYGLMAKKANDIIEIFFRHNKSNPIKSKGYDKIYFEPDMDLLKGDSYIVAQAKYASHFVTASPPDKSRRYYEPSKVIVTPFLLDALINPDERYEQEEEDRGIIYVKEIKVKRWCCAISRIELDIDGHMRAITALYTSKRGYIEAKKASGFWRDAFFPSNIEKSPSDETVSGLSGDTDISRTQDKDTNNNDTSSDDNKKLNNGGNIKNLIEIVEKNGKIRWEYQVDESAHHGSGSAIMYDYNGESYEIVTWNKNAEQHEAGEKTIAIGDKKYKDGIIKRFFDNIYWLITG